MYSFVTQKLPWKFKLHPFYEIHVIKMVSVVQTGAFLWSNSGEKPDYLEKHMSNLMTTNCLTCQQKESNLGHTGGRSES